jgi:multiple sugar transport system substrate-binding protein
MSHKGLRAPISRRSLLKTAVAAGIAAAGPAARFGLRPAAAASAWEEAPKASKPAKLTYIYWPWGKAQDTMIPKFEENWGVKVEKMAEPNVEPLFAKVMAMSAAGEQLDVIKGITGYLGIWVKNKIIQPIDGLPGLEQYKQEMTSLSLQSIQYQGKFYGLPYYSSIFTVGYFEDLFKKAGLKDPPKTWDEMVEQAQKAKRDGVSNFPIVWVGGAGSEHVTYVWYQLVWSRGGIVFDKDMNLKVEPGSKARESLAWWRKTFVDWKVSDPKSLELRFIPAAKAVWTGQYIFHPLTHHYYFQWMNREGESPIAGKVKMFHMPDTGKTLGWTALECLSANTKSKDWAWMLLQHVGGRTKKGDFEMAKFFANDAMLGSGFKTVMQDPEIKKHWNRWADVDVLAKQWDQATDLLQGVPALAEPWFLKWQDDAVVQVQSCLAGKITADQACDAMLQKYKEVKK